METIFGFLIGFALVAFFIVLRLKPWSASAIVNSGSGSEPAVVGWINATHAILTVANNKSPQIYGGVRDRESQEQAERGALLDWWDISDRQSLLDMVEWLIDGGGHRTQYEGPVQEIAGWDYSRALQLLSSAYLAGYLSKEEALNRSLPIAKLCQQEYDSWDDFIQSYLKGYVYWSGSTGGERERIYQKIKESENSVYQIPWNLKLVKEW